MRFQCPHCNRPFGVEHPVAEQAVECPHCGAAMVLPAAKEPNPVQSRSSAQGVDLGFDPREVQGLSKPTAPKSVPATIPASAAVPTPATPVPRRKRSREESRRRRQVRSIVVMVVCLVVLLASALVMSHW